MDRFLRAFNVINSPAVEGGESDHPEDNGGRTNHGVTQKRYDQHRRSLGQPLRDVYRIEAHEVEDIYRTYWDMARCDDLPDGVAFLAFDAAINSGPSWSVKFMQEAAGMPPGARDGIVGPATLAAVRAQPVHYLIDRMCDVRLAFLRSLADWRHFGDGWSNRIDLVRAKAHEFASGVEAPRPLAPLEAPEPIGAQRGEKSMGAVALEAASNPAVQRTVQAFAAPGLLTFLTGVNPVTVGIGVAIAAIGVVWAIRALQRQSAEG